MAEPIVTDCIKITWLKLKSGSKVETYEQSFLDVETARTVYDELIMHLRMFKENIDLIEGLDKHSEDD